MKKKLVSVLLAGVMTVGMLAGCGSSKGESTAKSKDYDLTLYSVMTTDPDFDEWLKNVEDATGLNINVIAAPTEYRNLIPSAAESEKRVIHGTGKAYQTFPIFQGRIRYVYE